MLSHTSFDEKPSLARRMDAVVAAGGLPLASKAVQNNPGHVGVQASGLGMIGSIARNVEHAARVALSGGEAAASINLINEPLLNSVHLHCGSASCV